MKIPVRLAALLLSASFALPAMAQLEMTPPRGMIARTDRINNGQQAPLGEGCARPEYPQAAVRWEMEGTSTVEYFVDTDGTPLESRVAESSGWPLLDRTTMSALALCKFTAPMQNGVAQRGWVRMSWVWRLTSGDGKPAVIKPAAHVPGSCKTDANLSIAAGDEDADVLLYVTVSNTGAWIETKVEHSSGVREVDRAAMELAPTCRYEAARSDGAATQGIARLRVRSARISRLPITEATLRTEYERMAADIRPRLAGKEQLHVYQILVRNETDAKEAVDNIQGGMRFERAAFAWSLDQSKFKGGDGGWVMLEEVPPEVATALRASAADGQAKIVKAGGLWYVLQVKGKRAAQPAPFEELRGAIERSLRLKS